LLALGLETVDEQREIEVLALGAVLARIALQAGEMIVEKKLRLPQKAADQGRLAVVDAAAGNEAQEALLADVGIRFQKYPSCFFRSIDAAPSWSMTRPWRSELRAPSVSATISDTVVALLSIAAVSG
jgi:formylmethanofuran dehydrogenase subunit A